ncbi:MAG: mannose-1-phosphate guanylyltransferase [Akkermansiaceae bacterium]
MSNAYALILAGGSGTRFWPLSRNAKPKQLLNLFDDSTLLDQTISRLDGIIPKENMLILTNALQEEGVREIAHMLPPENIFAEPAKRDTAPAVALGIGLVAARNPDAVMAVLPSDQLIQDTDAFQAVLADTLAAAQGTDGLVTIGIKPTWACPSYGYIELGKTADLGDVKLTHEAIEVVRFREKPNPELAETFLREGNFAWNAGMFIWSVKTVTAELQKHTPQLADFIEELKNSPDVLATIADKFADLTPISIDYALMEKASRVLNIEATFDWDDVGSWISVAKYLKLQGKEGEENRTNTDLTEIDSQNNIVFNARKGSKIALLGVDDLIVVQTDDAVLVANRHQADDIKKIVDLLPPELQ